MAKYIDAERLKAEIEKRLKNIRDYVTGVGMKYKGPKYYKMQGKESAYDALLSIIYSLQQEQPEVDLDKLVNEEFASHSRTTVYGLEATYNRAELYQLIKRMALVFNARKEE